MYRKRSTSNKNQRVGTRAQVMHGTAKMTGGGLKRKDLKYNKHGKIVSKKMSTIAKKEKRLQKAGYKTEKGVFQLFQKQRGGGLDDSILQENNLRQLVSDDLVWKDALRMLVPPLLDTNPNSNSLSFINQKRTNKRQTSLATDVSNIQSTIGSNEPNILALKSKIKNYSYARNDRGSYLYNEDVDEEQLKKQRLNYDLLCRSLYEYKYKLTEQTVGELYKEYAKKSIFCARRQGDTKKKVVLYFNFKSHNIFTKQEQMFKIIEEIKPDIICLSEALVPNNIRDHFKERKGKYVLKGKWKEEMVIEQPSIPVSPFGEKKIAEHQKYFKTKPININGTTNNKGISTAKNETTYTETNQNKENGYTFSVDSDGIKCTNFRWEIKLKNFGYEHLLFSKPTHCTWGNNWGNVIITKDNDDLGEFQMNIPTTKMPGFAPDGVQESRSAVYCIVGNKLIVSTHLEDSIHSVQLQQAKELLSEINKLKKRLEEGSKPIDKVVLVGDMNSLDESAYTSKQFNIIRAHLRHGDAPVKTFDYLKNSTNFSNGEVINEGQKFESVYQKCVTHAFSSVKDENEAYIYFTDVSDFDHQPLVLLV